MKTLSVEWIILLTDKYIESKKFYAQVLELPIIREIDAEEFTQFKMENLFLNLENYVPHKLMTYQLNQIYCFA